MKLAESRFRKFLFKVTDGVLWVINWDFHWLRQCELSFKLDLVFNCLLKFFYLKLNDGYLIYMTNLKNTSLIWCVVVCDSVTLVAKPLSPLMQPPDHRNYCQVSERCTKYPITATVSTIFQKRTKLLLISWILGRKNLTNIRISSFIQLFSSENKFKLKNWKKFLRFNFAGDNFSLELNCRISGDNFNGFLSVIFAIWEIYHRFPPGMFSPLIAFPYSRFAKLDLPNFHFHLQIWPNFLL